MGAGVDVGYQLVVFDNLAFNAGLGAMWIRGKADVHAAILPDPSRSSSGGSGSLKTLSVDEQDDFVLPLVTLGVGFAL